MSASQPRVCLVTDSREPSGMGRHMVDLVSELRDGHELVVAAPRSPLAGALLLAMQRLGVEVWELPDADCDTQATELAARLRREPVDLLHVHAGITWEGHEMAEAARTVGVRAVLRTEHCPYVLTKKVDARRYAAGIRSVDLLVCVSHGVAGTFRRAGVPDELIRVVPNGIANRAPRRSAAAVRDALGIPAGAPLAVSVGRLTEQKGHANLLRAVPGVLRHVPRARFVWVGDGPLEGLLRDAIEAAQLINVVTLIPAYDDVAALLNAADVVVLPSRFEGLPLVALEAMAVGRAVVATAAVGLMEAVRDRVTGRLVPLDNDAAMAEAIAELLADPAMARRWGAAGQGWQRQSFTAARMAADTALLYAELLEAQHSERVLVSLAAG